MIAEKVVKLNTNRVYDDICKFLRKKEIRSVDTSVAYKKDIVDFFNFKNKDILYLSRNDIQVTLEDFDDFILECIDSGNLAHSSINRKVSTMKSLLDYLKARRYDVDTSYFKQIDRLPEDIQSYGVFTVEEAEHSARLVLERERQKKEIKYYLILFSMDTCIRQTASLNLKWTDFEVMSDFVGIKSIDKGNKKFKKKIAKEFYEELLTLNKGQENVFEISKDTISDMMGRLRKWMNIPKERHIVFHSYRKTGITFAYNTTKDPLAAMAAGNHSNFDTTKRYIDDRDYGAIGAYSMTKNLNENFMDSLTKEEIINLVKSCDRDISIILSVKAKEMYREKFELPVSE
jgi:integrase